MLLLSQIGSVKVGEVVRYTVTYTPSQDRILPSPEHLFLRIRNTSAIALRAAFVHGPYTLAVAAYPASYNPNEKFAHPRRYGVPEFEPQLKAGGTWSCRLIVPDDIRQGAGDGASQGYFGGGPDQDGKSAAWIVEVASQVVFSASAAVHFEVLLARDEKSLGSAGSVPVLGGQAQVPQPGKVSDYQRGRDGQHPDQPKGVFSRAIKLKVEDTGALWNTPKLPGWSELASVKIKADGGEAAVVPKVPEAKAQHEAADNNVKPTPKQPKPVHLVILTHGLHSNLGSDLLYMKESIDQAAKQAKIDRKARLKREREARGKKKEAEQTKAGDTDADEGKGKVPVSSEPKSAATQASDGSEDEDDDEEVVVRGFSGNATRTERGIKYLGKRLARYVLSMTYPDQPFLPAAKAASETVASVFHSSSKADADAKPVHKRSSVHKTPSEGQRAYKVTKISFIGHSLGGLVQMYAIAYVQKHSPQFFDIIRPINFIALASPFLGLNHENPLYVKFALDFGLVGRTGQDLGLTWRAPTIARSGWGAIVGNLSESANKKVLGESQPESKPLLRILPTGPAHTALKKFRNRTAYSNVVNDGIVPLRTSCLLFLDWQGLERVDKARREAGLVETLVGVGWAELTGANVTSPRIGPWEPEGEKEKSARSRPTSPEVQHTDSHEVPQPSTDATLEDDRQSLRTATTPFDESPMASAAHLTATTNNANPFTGFFNLFKNDKPEPPLSQKQHQIYQRSQTLKLDEVSTATPSAASSKSRVTAGNDVSEVEDGLSAPPRTTFFESAADLINPKIPSIEYLLDPSKRPRAIFHDRVYHPSDIPPLPMKKRSLQSSIPGRRRSIHRAVSSVSTTTDKHASFSSTGSSPFATPGVVHENSMSSTRDYDDTANTNPDKGPDDVIDSSGMKVEEKIARAYHRGLSWRKVLVKLEPDAHNNLIVRRMFANAFGWPVVKHLVDAHFSDLAAARMRDEEESNEERAPATDEAPDEKGRETTTQQKGDAKQEQEEREKREDEEEARDTVSELPEEASSPQRPAHASRLDSFDWSDRDWADSEDSEADEELAYGGGGEKGKGSPAAGDKGGPSSPLGGAWNNWTEKIVGKGAAARAAKAEKEEKGGELKASPAPIREQKEAAGETRESDVD
jgi:hypothetical protein